MIWEAWTQQNCQHTGVGHNTYPTRTQPCQVRTQEEKKSSFFFLIQLFYFDVECCLFELFLWESSLFELFCSYFKQYFIVFKLILDIFPNISLLLHTFKIQKKHKRFQI